jgi:hypothetical protein
VQSIIHRAIKKLLQKSRISYYDSILDLAIKNGYILTSLADWYEHGFYNGRKVIVLRHDVDFNPKGAYKMFLKEKERGIKSTFYFRWSTLNHKIASKMLSAGFEVSLHFETLATYCKKNGIYQAKDITEDIKNHCNEILSQEVKRFENKYGKVKTICSHGDIWNMIVGIPNFSILKKTFCLENGIYFETYETKIKSRFINYISDSSINQNHEWKYGQTPEKAINEGIESICVLTHPHHWDYNVIQNIKLLYKSIAILVLKKNILHKLQN